MIPKKIHYCWFGGKTIPPEVNTYINSWRKHCPDYEIIEWNDNNFDYKKYRYSREAFEQKQWAFVSDVARLDIIYNYGGIYLDTDVEVLKSFDSLLNLKGFIGAEDKFDINTGAGFGAVKHHPFIKENLDEYIDRPLIINDKVNKVTCVEITTMILRRYGYRKADKVQEFKEMTVFPKDYFSPLKLTNNKLELTCNSYSIHYYSTKWKERSTFKKKFIRRTVNIKKFLRRNIDNIFGEGTYSKFKHRI